MRGVFDLDKLRSELIKLNDFCTDENLWNDKNQAQKILKEKSIIEQKIQNYDNLVAKFSDNLS